MVVRSAPRLAHLLDRLYEKGRHVTVITLPLTQEERAAWTASSREAVAKALQLLRRLGWVETQRRRIVVRDLPALREYAR